MANEAISKNLKRSVSGLPDKWKRNAIVNSQYVPVSTAKTSANANSKKRSRSNLPEPVTDADSNGKIEAIIYSFI